jgi:hypothetical protein
VYFGYFLVLRREAFTATVTTLKGRFCKNGDCPETTRLIVRYDDVAIKRFLAFMELVERYNRLANYKGPIMRADPNGPTRRRVECAGEGVTKGLKDAFYVNEAGAVVESVQQGSLAPLANLFNLGTATEGAELGTDYVARHGDTARTIIRTLRGQGVATTASAVRSTAATGSKFLGVFGKLISAYSGYKGYSNCMAQ